MDNEPYIDPNLTSEELRNTLAAALAEVEEARADARDAAKAASDEANERLKMSDAYDRVRAERGALQRQLGEVRALMEAPAAPSSFYTIGFPNHYEELAELYDETFANKLKEALAVQEITPEVFTRTSRIRLAQKLYSLIHPEYDWAFFESDGGKYLEAADVLLTDYPQLREEPTPAEFEWGVWIEGSVAYFGVTVCETLDEAKEAAASDKHWRSTTPRTVGKRPKAVPAPWVTLTPEELA